MMAWIDTSPAINVEPAEYHRLLGYPRQRRPEGRALELIEWARHWYQEHGRPWVAARQVSTVSLRDTHVQIEGVSFSAERLHHRLRHADAESAVLVAVSAGPELEDEAHNLWADGKPDEYFFLEVFGSAVVEHLTTMTGARLCAWAEERQWAVLPHDSPGYPGWDIAEQGSLLEVIRSTPTIPLRGPIEVLDSGALKPKKSLLAVFGLTAHTDRLERLTALVPCHNCSYTPCQYRRGPYKRSVETADGQGRSTGASPDASPSGMPRYAVNPRALQRWAEERLSVCRRHDGTVEALFRYEGTTCTNMGRPLLFEYSVSLGPREEGYPIREQRCTPAADDTGHTSMCGYIERSERLMADIRNDRPLHGQPLDAVLSWRRPVSAAGCYCDSDSREHKWGLVLETIHYALHRT
jgi:hypothetical protein